MGRERRTTSRGGAALYPGRTVILGSSFTGVSIAKVYPYFADITRVPELLNAEAAGQLPRDESLLIRLIKRSKLFIFEDVERDFWGVRTASVLRPEFLDRLERALDSSR